MSSIEFSKQLNDLSGLLQAFAYKLTKNVEDSKDLFQETACRAYSYKDKFSPGTNMKAWLFTIMRNIFINDYRKKIKSNTIFDATDNYYYLNSGKKTVYNQAESSIMLKELKKMVEVLEPSIKVPFLMHYYGYKYQEIADQLNLPLGTIKSRIFFARKELKATIRKRYGKLVG
ncbi:MAG: RNA polymerase sigma factor [Saprospiraceae bacterium]|nr:RNA polymerase sigma factor [Saprospiraceae bacterium]